MDTNNLKLWNNITFKTEGYRKNFDFINDDENIITEYDGKISEIRISELKPPHIIGEYGFSVWHIDLGKKFNVNLKKLIANHHIEDTYDELLKIIKQNDFNFENINKLVLIHSFVLKRDYRKRGITEEFIETIYRDFFGENVAIIMLVKPLQYNKIDFDFYKHHKSVQVKESLKSKNASYIHAMEYYSLNEMLKREDMEMNEYKLFNVANKCGFSRIGESHLFKFIPDKIIKRMNDKHQYLKTNKLI